MKTNHITFPPKTSTEYIDARPHRKVCSADLLLHCVQKHLNIIQSVNSEDVVSWSRGKCGSYDQVALEASPNHDPSRLQAP